MNRGGVCYSQPINQRHPLGRGLVSCWLPLPWYKSGPRLIDIAGRNHGTLTNGATWAGAPNAFGGVRLTAASSQYVAGTGDLGSPSIFSVAAWIYPVTLPSVSTILGWSTFSGPQFRIESSGALRWVRQAAADIGAGTAGAVVTGKWQLVAGSYDSATGAFDFWVDGVPAGSGSSAQTLTYSNWTIGFSNGGTEYPDATIGGVIVWGGRYLTASDNVALTDQFRRGLPTLLNRIPRRSAVQAAAATGNRRRRVLLGRAA